MIEVTNKRKLVDSLGSNWRIRESTYEDGPPHRTILQKLIKERWAEVATIVGAPNCIGPSRIRVRDKDIAEEIDSTLNSADLSYEVVLVH